IKGDLWEAAAILFRANELRSKPAHINNTEAQIEIMAKAIVADEFQGKKPPAFKAATAGYLLGKASISGMGYDNPVIKTPSDFILSDPDLLNQFCEMVAARIRFGDFGVHHGNFVVIKEGSKYRL